MALNSYAFIFLFLPIVLAGYYALTRLFQDQRPALVWLVASSLLFYGLRGPGYLLVLIGSVGGNFLAAKAMGRFPEGSRNRRRLLALGIIANLVLLFTYKYTGFFADNLNALFGTHLTSPISAYPVGLSFYTFIQIGFLIDVYVGQVEKLTFLRYSLFGMFFPYITSGPIVRHSEISAQLDTPVRERTGATQLAVGLTMFAMGLFKKAVLADMLAPYVNTMFSTVAGHHAVSANNAWIAVLAYTFELYFDFSGYTDMALGLGYALGLRLPMNFNSPLRATSLIDFWRRWHMTMVRFFTSYVYTPLAATMMRRSFRRGHSEPVRLLTVVCLPVFVTFVLVGWWHGAAWGFIISGAIHGIALSVNLTWRELQAKYTLRRIPTPVGWALMFLTVMFSLIFLRADGVRSAFTVAGTMLGIAHQGSTGISAFYGTQRLFNAFTIAPVLFWLLLAAAVALLVPRNSQQILADYDVALPSLPSLEKEPRFRMAWRPTPSWALAAAVVGGCALTFVGGASPFLYYKF